MKLKKILGIFIIPFLFSACTNNNALVDLNSPVRVVSDNAVANGATVSITDVTDSRVFTTNPNSNNTPSGITLTKDYKARAYGRILNLLGDNKGGILLPNDKTVASVVQEVITKAFVDNGYNVTRVEALDQEMSDIQVKIDVKQFWTYSDMEKINQKIIGDIAVDVYFTKDNTTKVLHLKTQQNRKALASTKGQYQKTMSEALDNLYNLALDKIQYL